MRWAPALRWPSLPDLVLPAQTLVISIFAVMVALDAADAYAFAGIPLQWLGFSIAIPLVVVHASMCKLRVPPGMTSLLLLLGWLLLTTLFGTLAGGYAAEMPALATTPYPIFVFLRVFTFLAFAAALVVLYNLHLQGRSDSIMMILSAVAVAVTLFAIYVVAAQKLGLPQPNRLRWGTGDEGAQSGGAEGIYTNEGGTGYLFRFVGSFREPSTMAVWLITPFFVSLTRRHRRRWWVSLMIGLGILGTGSLTTAISIPVGYLLALLLTGTFDRTSAKILFGSVFAAALVIGSVEIATRIILGADASFVEQFGSRFALLADKGLLASNRAYIFENFIDSPFDLFGIGLGNAHIRNSTGTIVVAFNNLYFHAWFAGGAIGMALVIFYVLLPLVLAVAKRRQAIGTDRLWYLAAYIAWLLTFIANAEAFSLMFTVALAGLLYEVRPRDHRARVST